MTHGGRSLQMWAPSEIKWIISSQLTRLLCAPEGQTFNVILRLPNIWKSLPVSHSGHSRYNFKTLLRFQVCACWNSFFKYNLKQQDILVFLHIWEVIIAPLMSAWCMLNNLFSFYTGVPAGGISERQLSPSSLWLNISAASVATNRFENVKQQTHYLKMLLLLTP